MTSMSLYLDEGGVAKAGVAAVRSCPLTQTFKAATPGLPAIKRGTATFHDHAYPIFHRFSLGYVEAQHGMHLHQRCSSLKAQRKAFQSCRSARSKCHLHCDCTHRASRRLQRPFVDDFATFPTAPEALKD